MDQNMIKDVIAHYQKETPQIVLNILDHTLSSLHSSTYPSILYKHNPPTFKRSLSLSLSPSRMAPLFLLLLILLISPSSASRSYNVDTTAAPTPHANGPITTKGQTYRTVCNPARFTALGLDINNFPYCNASLPYPERVKDLIGRMTVGEKVKQISDDSWGVERIGLPPYGWWSEILHGVSTVGQYNNKAATRFGGDVPGATQFPEVILSTASFNESLWRVIAEVSSNLQMKNMDNKYLRIIVFFGQHMILI